MNNEYKILVTTASYGIGLHTLVIDFKTEAAAETALNAINARGWKMQSALRLYEPEAKCSQKL